MEAQITGPGQISSVAIDDSGNGIIGGINNGATPAFAALVSSTGVTTALTGPAAPPIGAAIYSVAINSSGNGIIGGQFGFPYAALVSSTGVTTALTGPAIPPTKIGGVITAAINDLGKGIIGGFIQMGPHSVPYVALVSSTGVTAALTGSGIPTGMGTIEAVAINDSGTAIIGGEVVNSGTPYAALVSSAGVTTALTGTLPIATGGVIAVAITPSGNGILGGFQNLVGASATPYAAHFSAAGVATPLTGSALPAGSGYIRAVAINSAGNGIIGGYDNGSSPYAALVSSTGVTTALTGAALPMGSGAIIAVAINIYGNGIIGGGAGFLPYAALVSSSGVTTPISNIPMGSGSIESVAINSFGYGIIGGTIDGQPYYALVSSSGIASALSVADFPMGFDEISTDAISDLFSLNIPEVNIKHGL